MTSDCSYSSEKVYSAPTTSTIFSDLTSDDYLLESNSLTNFAGKNIFKNNILTRIMYERTLNSRLLFITWAYISWLFSYAIWRVSKLPKGLNRKIFTRFRVLCERAASRLEFASKTHRSSYFSNNRLKNVQNNFALNLWRYLLCNNQLYNILQQAE